MGLNRKYDCFLFDLDGTLTDSGPGITNSAAYALERFGIREKRQALYKFIGPPLLSSFQDFYGFSGEEAVRAVGLYREYYQEKGIYENGLYDGVKETLETLKERGKRVYLATSKPEDFAIKILRYFHIYDYFDFVSGATMDDSRSKKPDVIRYVLENCVLGNLSKAVMVGDREYDILGAKENGLDSVGVLYGYGSREELSGAGATWLVESMQELLGFVEDIQ